MEKRNIIFTDNDGHEVGRTKHDTSIISSLPRKDDTILETTKLDYQESQHIIYAKVTEVEFDYDNEVVNVYARVIRSA
jgi:hypothetical protein